MAFRPLQLDAKLGKWLPSRRFGIIQSGKVRVIDDYSASLVNSSVSAEETIDPGDLDRICANLRAHMTAVADGCGLSPGALRQSFYAGEPILGRMWDLAKAYRQLARRPSHSCFCVVGSWSPTAGCTQYFVQIALAFGSSASVLNFNWCSAALCLCLNRLLWVSCTNYYDDFCAFEFQALVESTSLCVSEFFDLLGWSLKDLPCFGQAPEPLGCVVNLRNAHHGLAEVANRPKRVDELTQAINRICSMRLVCKDELVKLRGRLMFARAQAFSRYGGAALRSLNAALTSSGREVCLAPELVSALLLLRDFLSNAPPRQLKDSYTAPVLLFTDGSAEWDDEASETGYIAEHLVAGIGGVLVDAVTNSMRFFSSRVPLSLLRLFLTDSPRQVICQIELLPQMIARRLWRSRLASRNVISFVDNEAAREGLVRGYSGVPSCARLIEISSKLDMVSGICCWFERAPTESNLADAPSRFSAPCVAAGFSSPVKDELRQDLFSLSETSGG